MNRAIARAIEGRRVELIEDRVKHARGVDEAHAQRAAEPVLKRTGEAR